VYQGFGNEAFPFLGPVAMCWEGDSPSKRFRLPRSAKKTSLLQRGGRDALLRGRLQMGGGGAERQCDVMAACDASAAPPPPPPIIGRAGAHPYRLFLREGRFHGNQVVAQGLGTCSSSSVSTHSFVRLRIKRCVLPSSQDAPGQGKTSGPCRWRCGMREFEGPPGFPFHTFILPCPSSSYR
jgi:hypothetical protein